MLKLGKWLLSSGPRDARKVRHGNFSDDAHPWTFNDGEIFRSVEPEGRQALSHFFYYVGGH